jgi:DNA topoisomerase IB
VDLPPGIPCPTGAGEVRPLIRFGERLPDLRRAMSEHMDHDELDRERVSAIALRRACAPRRNPETETAAKRSVSAVMRRVAEQLGNTPAVTRASYVSPAVVEQYLEGRTLEDFRPGHLRVVGARDIGLDPENKRC